MSLVYDARVQLAGQAQLHALIVGVGKYPHLDGGTAPAQDTWGMTQLTSTQPSAIAVLDWLVAADAQGLLPVRLGTCRILTSPVTPANGKLSGATTIPSLRQAAKDWQTDAATSRDNVTLFYFAGHGIQRFKEDALMCLEEFLMPAAPDLTGAISLADIRAGMAPSLTLPDIARTQLYFVDACRLQPPQLGLLDEPGVSAIFNSYKSGADDRIAPVYLAAISNAAANALPNHPDFGALGGRTLFSYALLECLKGDAGDLRQNSSTGADEWVVTVGTLNNALRSKMDDLNRSFQANQTYTTAGSFGDPVVARLSAAPNVEFILHLDPSTAGALATLLLKELPNGQPFELQPVPVPYRTNVPAGMYGLDLKFLPPNYPAMQKAWYVRPYRFTQRVRV